MLRFVRRYLFNIFMALTLFILMMGCRHDYGMSSEGRFLSRLHRPENVEVVKRFGKSFRGAINSMPVLVLRGSLEEMGEAQGVLAGKEIIWLLDNILIPYVNKSQPNAWITKVIPVASKFVLTERYEKELASILRGIEKEFPDRQDRMLLSIHREIGIDDLHALNCVGDIIYLEGGCSSFSAWGSFTENGGVICGYNLDERYIPGKMPFMVVAREPSEPNRQASVGVSGPGLVGSYTAMNGDGVVLMVHHESGLQAHPSKRWVPRAIVHRDAVESAGFDTSVKRISQVFMNRPVQLGSNTHLVFNRRAESGEPQACVLEWDGNKREDGVTLRYPDPFAVRNGMVCTNHYLKRRPERITGQEGSRERFNTLMKGLQRFQASGRIVDVIQAAKMMDSVAQNGDTVTYLSLIAVPRERRLVFAISPGRGIPATKGRWMEIMWNQVFGAS